MSDETRPAEEAAEFLTEADEGAVVEPRHVRIARALVASERECAELREERDRLSERLATHDEMRLAAYAATERDKARAELEALRQRIAAQR